ncbi:MAG TPA: hypothetical protein VNC63_11655 [Propionibacteriaceae bacterium]|jgi:hypothetical protein|nr:hypothetical protein [Propionibacteriaceae bacterium]
MSPTEPPAEQPDPQSPGPEWPTFDGAADTAFERASDATGEYVPVTPLLAADPPKVGEFWLDARLTAAPAGIAFTGHDAANTPALVILLSEGAAADAAARSRFAGEINALHIDTVLARGGHGQDAGRLARRFRKEDDDPIAPDDRLVAPWAALVYDGSPASAAQASQILDAVQIATLPPQGVPSGPDYQQYWIERVRPGLARLWPLPWPGRFDRAGWRTILVSWLLMVLLAALAILIAILIFRNQPPQSPPPPTGSSAQSGPPQSGSPQSGSQSGSPQSPGPSGSPSSGSPGPSGTESGGGQPTESVTGSPATSQSPGSRL